MNQFREILLSGVNEFIHALLQHPDIQWFAMTLMAVLIALVYFTEVSKFMLSGLDMESIAQATLMVFATLLLFGSFTTVFDVAYAMFDDLGLLFLKVGTGNADPFFLSKWVSKSLGYLYGEDVSLFNMAIGDVFYTGLWHVTAFLLQAAMMVISIWSLLTLALAKILGLLFIPLLAHPGTRGLFDGWFKLVLGSLLLLVLLRATGVLVAIALKAQFHTIGVINCQGNPDLSACSYAARNVSHMSTEDFGQAICTMVLSIALVLASMSFAAAIGGSVVSPSKSVGRGAAQLAKKFIKF